ncbi:MAG: hypothetical protein NVS1B4_03030 [Gemmatimonadaceae bacterium]
MNHVVLATVAALPWAVVPVIVALRAHDTTTLSDFASDNAVDSPAVTVVVPARDEARNIDRCLRSILATTYTRLDVVVVDDGSRDQTAAMAQKIADADGRVRVLGCPALPAGWFGKPWACAVGAATARGDVICFTDADTVHGPDLISRAVAAMRANDAALLSVAGRQEMGTCWERVVQPQLFTMIAAWYGGTDRINRSSRVDRKIANGQFLLASRRVYEVLGGHAAVRDKVAEDLMLAQRWFTAGERVWLVRGVDQLATRMYTSLSEVVRGWRKNVYAGSADALPVMRGKRLLHPILLLSVPVATLAPVVALIVAAVAGWGAVALWGALATAAQLAWWTAVYRELRERTLYALAFPVGAAVLGYIISSAIWRGHHVVWKGRRYAPPR